MTLPIHVRCEQAGPLLFALSDGRFQLLESRAPAPLMQGHEYLIVEPELASVLMSLGVPGLRAEKAILFDPASNTEHHSFVRLLLAGGEPPAGEPSAGQSVLEIVDSEIFVSHELRASLEAKFGYLCFSDGLSQFGAIAA